MGFLQGPLTNVNQLSPADPAVDASFAAVVPVMTSDDPGRSIDTVLPAIQAADPERIVVPARGDRESVAALAARVHSATDRASVLWCNSPSLEALVASHGIDEAGKGADVWLALGLAAEAADVVCCVDADVASLTPSAVRRLVAPIDESILAAKAWYTRVEEGRLYGRLCRLLVGPLVLALADRHDHPFLDYLRAFRYPLAGEIALHGRLVDELRVPTGMGLEVGTLGELFRLVGPDGTAQVDLGNHRHDHRPIDGDGGLVGIAPAVSGALAELIDQHVGAGFDDDLADSYAAWATRLVDRYERDARLNGLEYDANDELEQVNRYRDAVADPAAVSWTPSWSSATFTPAEVLEAGRPPGIASADR